MKNFKLTHDSNIVLRTMVAFSILIALSQNYDVTGYLLGSWIGTFIVCALEDMSNE